MQKKNSQASQKMIEIAQRDAAFLISLGEQLEKLSSPCEHRTEKQEQEMKKFKLQLKEALEQDILEQMMEKINDSDRSASQGQ
jgi:hypothetical protein